MTATLVLVRHGQSVWNEKNLFTGWEDVDLTAKGEAEAKAAGVRLAAAGYRFDLAFTSALKRAQRTLAIILAELGQPDLRTIRSEALNERDYGELVGLNKDDARRRWGDDQVHLWRRSYDIAPPGGESLADTAERVLPYYEGTIRPELRDGRCVIVAAHGNSLRALIMALEGLSPAEIVEINLATGVPMVYRLAADGTISPRAELG
ncbi:MAG: 2,3-bisphosphoglycerate-dependent phosphoglycerate mutase [Rhizobiales bacterium]|nr:2,3-bisphosphoglycerate-dependent phosphoglycerate mutase [Hyphomicrobiales bacterium]